MLAQKTSRARVALQSIDDSKEPSPPKDRMRAFGALVKDMEMTFDGPVVTSAKGETSDGGTELTELGLTLLRTSRWV